MTLSDWVESAALTVVFFLLAGLFRMVWALAHNAERQHQAVSAHGDAINAQAQKLDDISMLLIRTALVIPPQGGDDYDTTEGQTNDDPS